MNNMIKIFTEKRVRILKLILEHDGLHIREIAERVGVNPASAHKAIKLFEKMDIISEKMVKNKKTITANRNNTILKKIKTLINISELYDKCVVLNVLTI